MNCDNTGAVAVANSGYSRAPHIMHLLQCLFFIRAIYQFSEQVVYIEGADNTWADAISRNYSVLVDSQVFKSTYQRTPPSRRAHNTADGGATGLDVQSLGQTVQELFTAGLAPATLKVYKTGTNAFCVSYNIDKPFPVTENVLTHFVAFLYKKGLKAGTMKSYLAATRYAQIKLGLGNPHMKDMAKLEYVIRGVKRLTSGPRQTRLPITLPLLVQLQHSWQVNQSRRDGLMLWAAATTCFFGFLRAGEVIVPSDSAFDPSIHLSYRDISVDNHPAPTHVAVNIKASKTDLFRRGVTIYLGRMHSMICPVVAVLKYMVDKGFSEGPLFVFEDGRPLTHERFVTAVRKALATAGVDTSKYCGHSFQIGAATTVAERGVQDSLIRTMGRWERSAYLLYIRTPRDKICAVAKTLLGDHK